MLCTQACVRTMGLSTGMQSRTKIVAYLKEPERSSMRFERLADDHAGVDVSVASSLDEAADALADANVLVTIGNHLGADAEKIYQKAGNLEWIQSFGTGVDNIKDHPALQNGVAVTNVHGVHGPQLSEAAFAAMLVFARHIADLVRNQDQAKWSKPHSTLLHGKTVGIFGLGAIANELAPRCKAFGMRVIGITGIRRDVPGFDVVYTTDELTDAVRELDYLVVLTPYSAATHHVVDADVFTAMGSDAVLINLSRGGVVDEAALIRALDSNEIAGAALDVFEQEPLPDDSPFWSHPNVFVTPHAAGFHTGYPEQAYAVVSENLALYLDGGIEALKNRV